MGSFSCECNDGVSGDGTSCADIDECTLDMNTCHTKANCLNSDGSFLCECNTGYMGTGIVGSH